LVKKGPERKDVIEAVIVLRKARKPLFSKLAQLLVAPRRKSVAVNVTKVARFSKPNAIVAIAGKVTGDGVLAHPVDVVAMDFSASASKKIEAAGGKCRDFSWLVKKGTKDVILLK
jgi:large subunit ribosomal protein L18e